jgi:hypothetical protein
MHDMKRLRDAIESGNHLARLGNLQSFDAESQFCSETLEPKFSGEMEIQGLDLL